MKRQLIFILLLTCFVSKSQDYFILNKNQKKTIDSVLKFVPFKYESFSFTQLKDSTKYIIPFGLSQNSDFRKYMFANPQRQKIFNNIFLYVPLRKIEINELPELTNPF